VVDTRGFNGLSWLDGLGHPYTEDLDVIERYRAPRLRAHGDRIHS
jgi:hypothetical protein